MDYSSHSREPDPRHNHLIHPLSVCCSSQLAMCIHSGQWEPSKARNVSGHPQLLAPCTRSPSHLQLVLDRWSQKPTPWDRPGRTLQLLVLRPSMCLSNTMVCQLSVLSYRATLVPPTSHVLVCSCQMSSCHSTKQQTNLEIVNMKTPLLSFLTVLTRPCKPNLHSPLGFRIAP